MSFKIAPNALACGNFAPSSGSQINTAMNSAYVHRVSGAGFAIRLFARDLTSITDCYAYIGSFSGTKANVTMRARVFEEEPTNATRPGATLLATSTTTTLPAGASGWVRFEFGTPYSPTVIGEIVWIVIDNTAAVPATDFPNIRTTAANVGYPTQGFVVPYSTVAGFSGSGTAQPRGAAFFVQGGGTRGLTWTGVATPLATNTRARGVVFCPFADCTINMMDMASSVGAVMSQIRIWENTQLPNDTPVYEFNTGGPGRASSIRGTSIYFEPPFVARKKRTYYICWTTTANSVTPTCLTTDDYAAVSGVIDQNVDNFTLMPLVSDTGSNTWLINNEHYPRLQLVLGDLPPTTTTAGF